MKIRFETTIDDVVACRKFEAFRSRTWPLMAYLPLYLCYAVLLNGCYVLAIAHFGDRIPRQLSLLTVAIYVVLAYTGLFMIHQAASWILAWRTRRSLRGREARRVLGWCEMELDEWPLIVKTELMWYRIDLRAISHVVVQHRYAFVCVETGETYAIPLDRLPEQEEFRSFVAELRYAWENRHSGPPTEFRAPRMSPADERIEELR